jgi:hypothetical protein
MPGCDETGGGIQFTTNRHSYFNLVTNMAAVKGVLVRWQTMKQTRDKTGRMLIDGQVLSSW